MAYIGSTPTSQGFIPAVDYFSGNGSILAFTLSRNVASVYQVEVVIENVVQNPSSAYTVLNNTITFTSAPLSGTNNIYVKYVTISNTLVQPGVGTVGTSQLGDINSISSATTLSLKTNVGIERMKIDASGNVGIGTSSPTAKLDIGSGNLNFSGTAQRITGDFSNITYANRLAFQTTVANSQTVVTVIPNGTSTTASISLESDPLLTNDIYLQASSNIAGSNTTGFYSGIRGTGTYSPMTFYTGTTERMRIDSSGNVGIGTSSPSAKLEVGTLVDTTPATFTGTLKVSGATQTTLAAVGGIELPVADAYGIKIQALSSSGAALSFARRNNSATWVESMRIDSTGNLLVGKSAGSANVAGNQFGLVGAGYNESVSTNAGGTLALWYMNRQTSTGTVIEFRQAASTVGSISVTASATSFNPSSDIRLKDNITPITNGIERVSKLKPVDYTWKIDGTKDNGFIAQDLLKMPEFANRVNSIGKADDGSDLYGVDYMKFVSVLTAAIQELKAIIDTQSDTITKLQADVLALKGVK